MRRKLGLTLMMLGAAAIICSAALLIHNRQEDHRAGEASAQVLPQIEQTIRKAVERDSAAPLPLPQNEDAFVPTLPSKPMAQTITLSMPEAEIDGHNYVGYLSMPTIERQLPVMAQLEMPLLQIAPCRYSGSTYTDDLVIGAHNYHWHFGPIADLQPGDHLYFTDMDGFVSSYEVQGLETLMPGDVDQLLSSEGDLTLFTCTYGGQSRIVVRCCRVLGS